VIYIEVETPDTVVLCKLDVIVVVVRVVVEVEGSNVVVSVVGTVSVVVLVLGLAVTITVEVLTGIKMRETVWYVTRPVRVILGTAAGPDAVFFL
jgi:hypothetical protein